MKKQGFTLIELMVVIVIMGILAAVAVPKLFGMIAKSKASEVGPAAGTYVKLQDAFIAETGTYYGSWNKIGYTAPGQTNAGTASSATGSTTNFTYSQVGFYSTDETATVPASGAGAQVWKAANRLKLNDCPADENWNIKLEAGGSAAGAVKYTAYYKDSNSESKCSPLTAAFKNIGQ